MTSGQTILITGASGFIATHIVEAFLTAGYNVRGTVRSQQTADRVRQTFANYASQLELVVVPDVAKPGAFNEAVKGVDGVIHTATAFQLSVQDNERDLLRPAIEGTRYILEETEKNAPKVKRVVLTSSFAAMLDLSKGTWPGHVYDDKDWNPVTYEEASKKDAPAAVAYCAAKELAEKEAWKFVRESEPRFDVATILPPMVYGPNKNATATLSHLNTSSAVIYGLMSPTSKPSDPVPPTSFWSYVDVRDVAQAHLRAFQVPEAGGQRFLVCGGNCSIQHIVDILRKDVPEVKDRVPVGKPGSGFGGVELYTTDTSKSVKILGIKYHSLEQIVVDAAKSFLELEKKGRS